jgi:hypothetical protein
MKTQSENKTYWRAALCRRRSADKAAPSILALFVLCLCGLAVADESILLQRIVALENRMADLEEQLAPVLEKERVKKVAEQQRELARERMMLDGEYLSRLELNLVEKAYQTGNADWKAENADKALELLTGKFPQANRTGCAVLAKAQAVSGDEQIKLLKDAISTYGTCYYASGVNVGAYARLYLGMRYKKDGKDEDAAKLFNKLRADFPDAVDHKGQLLTTHLDGLE